MSALNFEHTRLCGVFGWASAGKLLYCLGQPQRWHYMTRYTISRMLHSPLSTGLAAAGSSSIDGFKIVLPP